MGRLIEGVWHEREPELAADGAFVRPATTFRNWITPDGRPGPTGHDGFAAARGRYHLFVSLACPWAHRTLLMRVLKGLQEIVTLSVTHWLMGSQGWTFAPGEGVVPDPLFGSSFLHEIYARGDRKYSGRASVPVLWDRHTQSIVNNESAEIMRMFNTAFDGAGAAAGDYYPEPLRAEIDSLNGRIYPTINDGVYKAGFARTQSAYDDAVSEVFGTLDWLEDRLSRNRFLCGDQLTEADLRLFTTLIRFDSVYLLLFRCNIRSIVQFPHLWTYTRDIYQWPGVAGTVDFKHIRQHYYLSHRELNPLGIIPAGPRLDLDKPARRDRNAAHPPAL